MTKNIKLINRDTAIDEMHAIFCKNQRGKNKDVVDDFIAKKRMEYDLEEKREKK